jgi:hypothetical protein
MQEGTCTNWRIGIVGQCWMKTPITISIFILTVSTALAFNEPTTIFGWKFGEDIRSKMRPCESDLERFDQQQRYERGQGPKPDDSPCIDGELDDEIDIKGVSIGRVGVRVSVTQLDNKLARVTVRFNAAFFNEITSTLLTKYGKPSVDFTRVMQNGFGVRRNVRTMVWKGKKIELFYTLIDFGTGFLQASTYEMLKREEQAFKDLSKKGVKDL